MPQGFVPDALFLGWARRRYWFMVDSIREELLMHLPELGDDRGQEIAENVAAILMRDDRDALTQAGTAGIPSRRHHPRRESEPVTGQQAPPHP